jgi:hypothetical protein
VDAVLPLTDAYTRAGLVRYGLNYGQRDARKWKHGSQSQEAAPIVS